MDIESANWDAWEAQFRALAETVVQTTAITGINGAQQFLCLYGNNSLSEEEEFEALAVMAKHKERLLRKEVDTQYWQDTVLFLP